MAVRTGCGLSSTEMRMGAVGELQATKTLPSYRSLLDHTTGSLKDDYHTADVNETSRKTQIDCHTQ